MELVHHSSVEQDDPVAVAGVAGVVADVDVEAVVGVDVEAVAVVFDIIEHGLGVQWPLSLEACHWKMRRLVNAGLEDRDYGEAFDPYLKLVEEEVVLDDLDRIGDGLHALLL